MDQIQRLSSLETNTLLRSTWEPVPQFEFNPENSFSGNFNLRITEIDMPIRSVSLVLFGDANLMSPDISLVNNDMMIVGLTKMNPQVSS